MEKTKMTEFWTENWSKIFLLTIITMAVIYLRQLPYFNLILTPAATMVLLWLFCLIVFKFRSKSSVFIMAFALLITGIFMAFEGTNVAHQAANFAYYIAIVAVLQTLLERWYEKRKTK